VPQDGARGVPIIGYACIIVQICDDFFNFLGIVCLNKGYDCFLA